MDITKFREAYAANRKHTGAQRAGVAVVRANAHKRVIKLRALSKDGATLDEVAAELGMHRDAVRKLLRKELGSGRWPIVEEQE